MIDKKVTSRSNHQKFVCLFRKINQLPLTFLKVASGMKIYYAFPLMCIKNNLKQLPLMERYATDNVVNNSKWRTTEAKDV